MNEQMYFASMTCDKVTEDAIAYQISTIRPEIATQYNLCDRLHRRLYIPTKMNPRGMVATVRPSMGNFAYRASFVDNMCKALLPDDHCHDLDELSERLLGVLTAPDKKTRLVAITIVDGRLCFKIWQAAAAGFLDVKVLPTEIRGTDNFDFGIQTGRCSRDETLIRCVLDNGSQFRYVVESYHRGKIVAAKEIHYRAQQGKNRDRRAVPHFSGYINTLALQ